MPTEIPFHFVIAPLITREIKCLISELARLN